MNKKQKILFGLTVLIWLIIAAVNVVFLMPVSVGSEHNQAQNFSKEPARADYPALQDQNNYQNVWFQAESVFIDQDFDRIYPSFNSFWSSARLKNTVSMFDLIFSKFQAIMIDDADYFDIDAVDVDGDGVGFHDVVFEIAASHEGTLYYEISGRAYYNTGGSSYNSYSVTDAETIDQDQISQDGKIKIYFHHEWSYTSYTRGYAYIWDFGSDAWVQMATASDGSVSGSSCSRSRVLFDYVYFVPDDLEYYQRSQAFISEDPLTALRKITLDSAQYPNIQTTITHPTNWTYSHANPSVDATATTGQLVVEDIPKATVVDLFFHTDETSNGQGANTMHFFGKQVAHQGIEDDAMNGGYTFGTKSWDYENVAEGGRSWKLTFDSSCWIMPDFAEYPDGHYIMVFHAMADAGGEEIRIRATHVDGSAYSQNYTFSSDQADRWQLLYFEFTHQAGSNIIIDATQGNVIWFDNFNFYQMGAWQDAPLYENGLQVEGYAKTIGAYTCYDADAIPFTHQYDDGGGGATTESNTTFAGEDGHFNFTLSNLDQNLTAGDYLYLIKGAYGSDPVLLLAEYWMLTHQPETVTFSQYETDTFYFEVGSGSSDYWSYNIYVDGSLIASDVESGSLVTANNTKGNHALIIEPATFIKHALSWGYVNTTRLCFYGYDALNYSGSYEVTAGSSFISYFSSWSGTAENIQFGDVLTYVNGTVWYYPAGSIAGNHVNLTITDYYGNLINSSTVAYDEHLKIGLAFYTVIFDNDGTDKVRFVVNQTGSAHQFVMVLAPNSFFIQRFYIGNYTIYKQFEDPASTTNNSIWIDWDDQIIELGDTNAESVDVAHRGWGWLSSRDGAGGTVVNWANVGMLTIFVGAICVIGFIAYRDKRLKQYY